MEFIGKIWDHIKSNFLYLFFVGLAFVLTAPKEIRWIGWILLSLSVAIIIEKVIQEIKKSKDKKERKQYWLNTYEHLSQEELDVVNYFLNTNERTMMISEGKLHKYISLMRALTYKRIATAIDNYTYDFNDEFLETVKHKLKKIKCKKQTQLLQ